MNTMHLDALKRRLDKLERRAPMPTVLNLAEGIDFTLFNEQEQASLCALLARLQPYTEGCTLAAQVLNKVTNEELDELEHWTTLHEQRQQTAAFGQ
jgi:hypothetical protein